MDAYPNSLSIPPTKNWRVTGRSRPLTSTKCIAAVAMTTDIDSQCSSAHCGCSADSSMTSPSCQSGSRTTSVGRSADRQCCTSRAPTGAQPPHEYAQRLRTYLGYQPFDEERLQRWLDERAIAGVTGAALLDGALRTLRAWRVEAPARSTLERLVRSASSRGEEAT
jgi:hypothetical protein